jgi:nucleotide-binding universal stress UspA family protein
MLDRILIPLDGSALAESVLVQVRRLLARRDAELLLLQVVTLPPSNEADAGEPLDHLWSRATEYLQSVAGRLSSEGIRARTRVVEGFPAREILGAAKKEHADLIAMSTHGRTGIARWVFGSVTEKVLRGSPVPVLAIPSFLGIGGEATPRAAREVPFRKILVPLAAEEATLEVLPALTEFARLFGSEVRLLHVCEGVECSVATHELRMAFERLRNEGVPAEPLMKQGDPAVRILETCREEGADLIAMTTHGRTGVPRLLMGSVAEKVLGSANVPILVVRPGKKDRRIPAMRGTAGSLEFHSDP